MKRHDILIVVAVSAYVIVMAAFTARQMGLDWSRSDPAAWTQAIGSVAAILAAVAIDSGSSRRQAQRDRDARLAHLRDWEDCLNRVVRLANNASRLATKSDIHGFADAMPARLLDNASMMIDAYMRHPPPNPTLAFCLASAHSHLGVARDAIKNRRQTFERNQSQLIQAALADIVKERLAETATSLVRLQTEYELGVLSVVGHPVES